MEDSTQDKLIRKLYEVACKFDIAYLDAVRSGGAGSFTGEEYDELNDILCETEEYLGIE